MRWFLLGLLIGVISPARADVFGVPPPFLSRQVAPPTMGTSYIGPGDIAPGAIAWWGGRGYSAASAATGTEKAYNLRRQSDSIACDFLIATTGDMGLSTATCNGSTQGGITPTAFAGVDATGSGSISGTTLTFATGGHIGDVVTGGTTSPGTVIISGTGPTWGVNIFQTVASVTLTLTAGLSVVTAYDHTGNGHDCAQSNPAIQPQYLPGADPAGTKAAIKQIAGSYLTCGTISASQPYTVSPVAIRIANFTNGQLFMVSEGAFTQFGYTNSTNTLLLYAGTSLNAAASDNAWHAFQGVFNGGSSVINVDGSQTAGAAGSGSLSSTYDLLGYSGGSNFIGNWLEDGLWSSARSTGVQNSMSSNQHTYWGF